MTGKSVLITGGAQRIGASIARSFAEAGWHVIIHYNRSEDAARALAQELGNAQCVTCDLADGDAAVAMVQELAEQVADWRVLINNAALFLEDSVTALDPATNSLTMQVNAITPTRMAQAFLAKAQSAKGRRVIQITDQKLANPNPDFFSYSISKYAVDGAAQMLAQSCKGEDRVYRLAPGAILASHDQSKAEAEISHRLNLLGRRTKTSEIADAALLMAEGDLANGQQILVDSGQHLLAQKRDVIFLAREEKAQ